MSYPLTCVTKVGPVFSQTSKMQSAGWTSNQDNYNMKAGKDPFMSTAVGRSFNPGSVKAAGVSKFSSIDEGIMVTLPLTAGGGTTRGSAFKTRNINCVKLNSLDYAC